MRGALTTEEAPLVVVDNAADADWVEGVARTVEPLFAVVVLLLGRGYAPPLAWADRLAVDLGSSSDAGIRCLRRNISEERSCTPVGSNGDGCARSAEEALVCCGDAADAATGDLSRSVDSLCMGELRGGSGELSGAELLIERSTVVVSRSDCCGPLTLGAVGLPSRGVAFSGLEMLLELVAEVDDSSLCSAESLAPALRRRWRRALDCGVDDAADLPTLTSGLRERRSAVFVGIPRSPAITGSGSPPSPIPPRTPWLIDLPSEVPSACADALGDC